MLARCARSAGRASGGAPPASGLGDRDRVSALQGEVLDLRERHRRWLWARALLIAPLRPQSNLSCLSAKREVGAVHGSPAPPRVPLGQFSASRRKAAAWAVAALAAFVSARALSIMKSWMMPA